LEELPSPSRRHSDHHFDVAHAGSGPPPVASGQDAIRWFVLHPLHEIGEADRDPIARYVGSVQKPARV
jgi:hypothetical protein